MKSIIRSEYIENLDQTIIFKDTTNGDEEVAMEIVGFYFGQPSDADTNKFIGKLEARFDTKATNCVGIIPPGCEKLVPIETEIDVQRRELVTIIETLEAMLPADEDDERLTTLLDSDITIEINKFKFTTMPSVTMLKLAIVSAKNDLYSFDVCKHSVGYAMQQQPEIEEIY